MTIFYYSVGAAAVRKIDAKATYLLQITISETLFSPAGGEADTLAANV